MQRRDLIKGIVASATVWPLAVRAQQRDGVKRLGILHSSSPTDADAQADMKVLEQTLQDLGWTPGGNLTIDFRWLRGNAASAQTLAKTLLGAAPDVVLAIGIAPVTAFRDETHTVPIVFVRVSNPQGLGLIASLAKPGGNVTGFSNFEPAMVGKWLQILKGVAPRVSRVDVMANPQSSALESYFHAISAAKEPLSVEPIMAAVHNLDEIEQAIAAASDKPGGGLIVIPDGFMIANRASIITLTNKYKLPAIYPFRYYVDEGGLVSYGIDTKEQMRGAASYVNRIFKGENPGDLPVQAPTKFELVINLKTAKALGLTIPSNFLLTADKVIE